MIRYFVFILFNLLCFSMYAADYSGIYNYNKGLNKANGTICLFQINADSAFFYLNNMSGAPDFNLTSIKGFLRIDSNNFYYQKDSCKVTLQFQNQIFSATQSVSCKNDFSVEGKYKKLNNTLKKPNTWMTEYTERNAVINSDSAIIYQAPHISSKQLMTLQKATNVKVIDEVNGFYLIEIPKKKSEFMWTARKNVIVSKN